MSAPTTQDFYEKQSKGWRDIAVQHEAFIIKCQQTLAPLGETRGDGFTMRAALQEGEREATIALVLGMMADYLR
jgi:hypothetical protein